MSKLKKLIPFIKGSVSVVRRTRPFRFREIFEDKTIAVVGAANSVHLREAGEFINGHDYVIRINRALINWKTEDEKYVGNRTDILFHNFFENDDTGGAGKLDIPLFQSFGMKYLIQPRSDIGGIRTMVNFYKKYQARTNTYTLPVKFYNEMKVEFGRYHPTKGFCALAAVLSAKCKSVYITGFTFFQTPYQSDYRNKQNDLQAVKEHIEKQNQHSPDLEISLFVKLVVNCEAEEIIVDQALFDILEEYGPTVIDKVKCF